MLSLSRLKNRLQGAKLSSGAIIRCPESSLPSKYRSFKGRTKKGKHDNSVAIFIDPRAYNGFRVHSHRDVSWQDKHAEISELLGLERWKPTPRKPRRFKPSRATFQLLGESNTISLEHGANDAMFAILVSDNRMAGHTGKGKVKCLVDFLGKSDADFERAWAKEPRKYTAQERAAAHGLPYVECLDNTLIIYIGGDNGASAEGMVNGTPNEFTTFNGISVPVKDQFLWYPFWGSERTFPHFAASWAWAMDTPFKWVKQVPSHFGGTAQGVVMSWPGHINDTGGIRRQFHHVIDIVPTILEATGIPAPDTINGIEQRPIEGVSMVYTWDKANANAPTRHTTQYFEMLGNRSIYHDGWVAATTPVTLPWELSTKTPPDVITGYNWELYNVQEDPTEFNDLATKMPEKLKEMQDLFYSEAKKYDVLPLDNSTLARWNTPRPSLTAGRTEFTYSGELAGTPASAAPSILNKGYTITAEVEIPEGGAEGMIVTQGGRFGGYGLFLSKGEFGVGRGKVVFLYNLLDLKRTMWEGPELEAGKHTIAFDFKPDGPGLGKGGVGVLSVDGKEVARNTLDHTTPVTFPEDESFDVGLDTRTGVAMVEYRYDVPFKFTGKLDKLTFKLEPEQHAEAKP